MMALTKADKMVINVLLCVILMSAAVACLTSCSQMEEPEAAKDNPAQVSITFSPYDIAPMTRSATSIATIASKLDVWIYENGSEVAAVHQSSSDVEFGSVSLTLDKTKTYTLYAIAHKADGATLSDGVISFTDDKVTHAMYYTTTFSPATTTSLSCQMTRIVSLFRLTITDEIPAAVKKLRFTISNVFDRWNVTTGGTNQLDRTSAITYGGTAANFSVYAITTDAQTMHDIMVEALDANGDVLQTRTFENVPLRNGYRTQYTGTFFIDTPTSATFTVESDWTDYDTVTF